MITGSITTEEMTTTVESTTTQEITYIEGNTTTNTPSISLSKILVLAKVIFQNIVLLTFVSNVIPCEKL